MTLLTDWVLWFALAFILLIAEIFTPGFVLACFSFGCLAAGIIALFGDAILLQLVVFMAGTLVFFFTIRPFALKHFYSSKDTVLTNIDALIHKSAVVIEAIDEDTGTGRVRMGGEDWRAKAADGSSIASGQHVTVIKVEGTTLKVIPKESQGEV